MKDDDADRDVLEGRAPVAGRRRFLGAGAVATPALLTLVSQPALGTTCFSPSRALSQNTSVSQQGNIGNCTGISPGNYKTQTNPCQPSSNWPASPMPTTAFHPFFAGSLFIVGKKTGGTRSLTLFEVLNLPSVPVDVTSVPTDPSKLAFHIIGAYLNVVNGYVPSNVLSTTGVATIWSEWSTVNYYSPVAGVNWYAPDIVAYLSNFAIAP